MRSNADLNLEVKPQILATLYTPNDETPSRSLTDTDFVSNSPEWQFGTSERDVFSVGGAVISSFDFTLMNDEGQFDGINWYDARVSVTLRCLLNNSDSTTDIDMGYYYVTKHHEQGNFITVECYDALKVLDEYQLHELGITDAQWETGLSISSLVSLIAAGPNNQVGLAVSGLSSVASSITVHNPNNDQMTLRAAVSYLAQMVGQYVRINVSGGTLVFGWYDLSSTHHAGTTFNHDLRTSDITISGATVSDYKDETVITASGSNVIAIKDNPFIDANNAQAVYNAVNSAVTGLTFRPGSATILASPAYEPGDALLINTGQEQNIKVIATNLTYKPQVTESISCDADPESGDLRINNLEYIKKQAQNSIDEELKDPTSELSQAIANAGGGDTEVIILTNTSYTVQSGSNPPYGGLIINENGITRLKIDYWTLDSIVESHIVPKYKEVGNGWKPRFYMRLPVTVFFNNGLNAHGCVDFFATRLREDVIELSDSYTLASSNMPTSSATSQDVVNGYIIWPRIASGSKIYLLKSNTPDAFGVYSWYAAGYAPGV